MKRLVVAKELVGRLAEKLGGGVTLEVLATAKVGVVLDQVVRRGTPTSSTTTVDSCLTP